MFSRLTFMRLRAAENALRGGKLDEAFRLAGADDLRGEPRAKAVLEQLAERFVERAREHFKADRFADALGDLDKAAAGQVRLDEIAQLRANVETVARAVSGSEASRRAALNEARRRVESGSLAAGQQIIDRAMPNDPDAARLGVAIQRKEAEAAVLVRQARQRLDENEFAGAVERLETARRLHAHHPDVVALEVRLTEEGLNRARQAAQEGRLARAAEEIKALRSIGQDDPRRREMEECLRAARRACDQFRERGYSDARKTLAALSPSLPSAKWVDRAIRQLKDLDELDCELRAGPLGQWTTWVDGPVRQPAAPRAAVPIMSARLDETVMLGAGRSVGDGLPSRLLILVDGGGSYLLLRGERCSIGRAATDQPADITLFGDLAERHADIARVDEDYFLFSSRDVEIGGRMHRQQLLRDGDRVVLGKRAKFEFRTPSRRSLTAVLTLSDTTKMPNDVRQVVLFKEHATLGSGSTAHIRCRQATQSVVLLDRGGRLWIQPLGDPSAGKWVELGQPVDIVGVSLVVQPWQGRIS